MSKIKTSLGRGLGSLLGEDAVNEVESHRVRLLPLTAIQPGRHQPRQRFAEETMVELADSIREQGVLQPVLVRRVSVRGEAERFELVAGERRWRAAGLAGLLEIPALVRDLNDRQAAEAALLENVQREDLNAVEVAKGYQRLVDEFGYTHDAVAKRLGLSRMAISNALRLLRLPDTVLVWLEQRSDTFSAGHARALLPVERDPELLLEMAGEVLAKGLSVRETERLVRDHQQHTPTPHKSKPAHNRRDPAITAMEQNLTNRFGATVSITSRAGRGKIILDYGSLEELEGLVSTLLEIK